MTNPYFIPLLKSEGIPIPEAEFRFAPPRRWRFDYFWPEHGLALEIDGAVWTGGRHTRGSGWMKDTEKLNEAACMGYRMLRCTPQQLLTVQMIGVIRKTLQAHSISVK